MCHKKFELNTDYIAKKNINFKHDFALGLKFKHNMPTEEDMAKGEYPTNFFSRVHANTGVLTHHSRLVGGGS